MAEDYSFEMQNQGKQGALFKDQTTLNAGEIINEIRDITRRVRLLEERSINTRKNIQVVEHNTIKNNTRINREIKILHSEIEELRKEMNDARDEIKLIENELKDCARKEDVEVLQHYIQMWQPVDFVTQNELKKVIHNEVKDIFEEINPRKRSNL